MRNSAESDNKVFLAQARYVNAKEQGFEPLIFQSADGIISDSSDTTPAQHLYLYKAWMASELPVPPAASSVTGDNKRDNTFVYEVDTTRNKGTPSMSV
ncbi:hypothetical protein ABVT39_027264 [Epinephelus coioides]